MDRYCHNGISGKTPRPNLCGAYDKSTPAGLIILACSGTVWSDYKTASELFQKKQHYDIMCIHDISIQFKIEPIEHIVSIHKDLAARFRAIRSVWCEESCFAHGQEEYAELDCIWRGLGEMATSSFFAVKIAIAMGYKKIIGCGMSMSGQKHYYDPQGMDNFIGNHSFGCDSYHRIWKTFHDENTEAQLRVRIASGKLSEIYGAPSKEWIYDTN